MGLSNYIKHWFRHDSNTRALLREVHRRQEETDLVLKEEFLKIHIEKVRQQTLTCHESGVSTEKLCDHEVIVSLTSFGERIHDVHVAIESIMQGSVKPNRIILWLSEEEFRNRPIPTTLKRQQQRGLEIAFCKDIRSYKKLIYTLQQNPEACIITIDDDVIYDFDIVERLIASHINHPNIICACRVHRVTLDSNGHPKSYLKWDDRVTSSDISPLNFSTGIGGVLYPPHCFSSEVFNSDIFLKLCPLADDIWFYAMALIKNTPILKIKTRIPDGHPTELPTSRVDALLSSNTNPEDCLNDKQLKAVFEHYNLFSKLQNLH